MTAFRTAARRSPAPPPSFRSRSAARLATFALAAVLAAGCSPAPSDDPSDDGTGSAAPSLGSAAASVDPGSGQALAFDTPRTLGGEGTAADPYLALAPDGRLAMTWTEVRMVEAPPASPAPSPGHAHAAPSGGMMPTHDAYLAFSEDGGATWSEGFRLNPDGDDVMGAENFPKILFGTRGQMYIVWSAPSAEGDRMRTNTRFLLCTAPGVCKKPVTVNEIRDASRFPVLSRGLDGTVYLAWIDRRLDSPEPRQLYMSRIGLDGTLLTTNYQIGRSPCECCRMGLAVSPVDGSVHLAYRNLADAKERNIAILNSTDGGATFGDPVIVSDDGWNVPACPHSGPTLLADESGNLHIAWYTYGRQPADAGIYYSISRDGGMTFSGRVMLAAAGGPTLLHTAMALGPDGTAYVAWNDLTADGSQLEMFVRTIRADGTLGPAQQLSQAQGDATRPFVAVSDGRVHVAWTETRGTASRIQLASAPVGP